MYKNWRNIILGCDQKTRKAMGSPTPLHLASKKGDMNEIISLLKSNADVDAQAADMSTPLYLAIEHSKLEVAKFLINYGASVDAVSLSGQTVLNLAVCRGLSTIVEDILKKSPSKCNVSNIDALKDAVKNRCQKNIVENLLKYGFGVEPYYIHDINFLHSAIEMGYIGIIEDLIKNGLDLPCKDKLNNCALHIAAKYKQTAIAKLLLTHGADVNAFDRHGKSPIFYSTENSDVILTKVLLSQGAFVPKNSELLRIACKKSCKELVEIFLEYNVNIESADTYGRTALHLTATSEYDGYMGSLLTSDSPDMKAKGEIAELLLRMGANVHAKNANGLTALHFACQKGFKNVVEVLLKYNADVNCVVRDYSPLLFAAQQGNASSMEVLLANGANVNIQRSNGDTALHIVARHGYADALKVLIKNGANVCSKNIYRAIPLHEASKQTNIETVSLLLEHGSPIDSTDLVGKTPLHNAVIARKVEVVEFLLNSGSDINILTNCNYTVFDLGDPMYNARKNVYDPIYDYSDDECTEYNYENFEGANNEMLIDEILRLHLIKLLNANLYIMKKHLRRMTRDYNDVESAHSAKCNEEIQQLKLDKIANNTLSFYDILTGNVHLLVKYARNQDIITALESDYIKNKFPIYAVHIRKNFEKSIRRRLLIERAQEFFLKYHVKLPYDCSDYILRYLSDDDLENIINA